MSSRFSAARPRRAGEAFARSHHGERDDDDGGGLPFKKVKFDVRNPSALVADAREEDDILDADVIGKGSGSATKRGAVNIDGYDSDSDNDNLDARAEARSDKPIDLLDQLDNYDSRLKGIGPAKQPDNGDDDVDDMFAEEEEEEDDEEGGARGKATAGGEHNGKGKEVRFLDDKDMVGQDLRSKSGGRVRLDKGADDNDESSEDEDEADLAIEEEGVDDEVGAGGLKRHAPKIDAFNMKQEQEEGAFDEAGNYIRKAADADAVHDRWLDGINKKDMKKAAAAHERRQADWREQLKTEESVITSDLLRHLILSLEKGETPLEALARLGRSQAKTKPKKIPQWKLKKQKQKWDNGFDLMQVDKDKDKGPEDPAQQRIKESIDKITDAADRLLRRDYQDIYETEREMLVREYRNETGEAWVDPPKVEEGDEDTEAKRQAEIQGSGKWEYRWTDGRDGGAKQGPFDTAMMKTWYDAGYFGEGVEFRQVGDEGWTRVAAFG